MKRFEYESDMFRMLREADNFHSNVLDILAGNEDRSREGQRGGVCSRISKT